MTAHVTIVGSGIASIAAAIEAKEGGAQVTIVRGRPGASALSSGAWDIADDLKEIMRGRPSHPYSLLSQNEASRNLSDFLERSIERVSNRLGLRLRGSTSGNMLVLNPLGGLKATGFVPQTHAAGNFLEMQGARLLILGFRGLPSFATTQIADFLRELLQKKGSPSLSKVSSGEISLKGLSSLLSPIDLAARLDDDEMIESLHQTLIHEAENHRATHIALAPVIGIQKTTHIFSRLTEATKLHWFETLGVPPSLPGLRLHRAIDFFLEGEATGKVIPGEAVGAQVKGSRVEAVRIRSQDREEDLPVDRLILATGRYLGGGIVREKSFREPILNLPLFAEGRPVGETFVGKLVSDKYGADHPLFSVGVRVSQNLQPVSDRGKVLYENLWAAGSLIGDYNPATQHCGMGVAVGTGTVAGRMAVS